VTPAYSSPGAELGAAIGNAIVDGFIAGFQQAEENARIEAEIRAREEAEEKAARQRALQDAALANYQQNQGLLNTLRAQPGAPGAAGSMQLRSADDMFSPAAVEQARANYCRAKLKADAYGSAMRSLDFASSSDLYATYEKMSAEQRSATINLLLDNALGLSADRLEAVSKLTPDTVGATIARIKTFGFDDPVVFDKLSQLAAVRGQTEKVAEVWGETVDVIGGIRSGIDAGGADLSERNGKLEALSAALGMVQNNPTLGIGITGFQLGLSAGFAYTLDHGIQDADKRLEADLARQKELQAKIEDSVQQASLAKFAWRGAGGQGEPNCPGSAGTEVKAPAAGQLTQTPASPNNAAGVRSPTGSSIGSTAAEAQQRQRYAADTQFAAADAAVADAREKQIAAENYADELRALMRNPAASIAERNAARLKLPDAQSAATNAASAVRVAEIRRDEAADDAEGRMQAEAVAAQQAATAQGFAPDDFVGLRDAVKSGDNHQAGGKLSPFSAGAVTPGAVPDLAPGDGRGATPAANTLGVLRHITDGTDTIGQGVEGRSDGVRVTASAVTVGERTGATNIEGYGSVSPDVAEKILTDPDYQKLASDISGKRQNLDVAKASQQKAWDAFGVASPAEAPEKERIARQADAAVKKANDSFTTAENERIKFVEKYVNLSKPVKVKPKVEVPSPVSPPQGGNQ
jgi:hypothetical protein